MDRRRLTMLAILTRMHKVGDERWRSEPATDALLSSDVWLGGGSPHVFARRHQCVCAGGRFKGSRRCQKSVPSRGWCPLMRDDRSFCCRRRRPINLSAAARRKSVGCDSLAMPQCEGRRPTAMQMALVIAPLIDCGLSLPFLPPPQPLIVIPRTNWA